MGGRSKRKAAWKRLGRCKICGSKPDHGQLCDRCRKMRNSGRSAAHFLGKSPLGKRAMKNQFTEDRRLAAKAMFGKPDR